MMTTKLRKNEKSRSGNTRLTSLWTFTLNNYTESEETKLRKSLEECPKVKDFIYGHEIGGEEKTPHLQGAIRLHDTVSFNYMIKLLDNQRFHIEKMRCQWINNVKYCSKEGNDIVASFDVEEYLDKWEQKYSQKNNKSYQQKITDRTDTPKLDPRTDEEIMDLIREFIWKENRWTEEEYQDYLKETGNTREGKRKYWDKEIKDIAI